MMRKGSGLRRNQEQIHLPTPENEYYEAVSQRLGLAQVFLYLVLLAFVAVSLLTNTELITYQNLYYFVKDLNATSERVDVLYSDAVSYPTDPSQDFVLYRQGLAVAGNTSVTVFTATGRQTVSRNVQYQNPVAVGSGKYLLVYELEGNQYSLYNSYTQLHTGKTSYPIRCATMSPCGMYAVVTRSEQYSSVVELYSSDFKLLGRYSYHDYVTDVAIDEKGDYVSILISGMRNGSYSTELKTYRTKSDQVFATCDLGNGLGLQCGFTDADRLAVLCGNGIYYFSVRGELLSEATFDGQTLTAFDMTARGCVAVLKKSGNILDHSVIVFDKSGKELYRGELKQNVQAVAMGDGAFYVMHPNGVTRVEAAKGKTAELSYETENCKMLVLDDGRVLLCSPQRAAYYRFS